MLVKSDNVAPNAKILVIGVGGGGCNAVNTMISDHNIQGVQFVAINTDSQALQNSLAENTITIGMQTTKGLGSGGNPEVGQKAAEESMEQLHELLTGADMVFITAGMGGGTGTGAAPTIAGIAKNLQVLTIGVVTTPFDFEGKPRMNNALKGVEEMKSRVDTLIVIPNQRLLSVINSKVSFHDALKQVDDVLARAVRSITDIITLPGLVNRDFADVKTIMLGAGTAMMGMGSASGENRAEIATKQAIESPLLDMSITGATKGLLFISGSENFTLDELNTSATIIREQMEPEAELTWGGTIDSALGDELRVTVLATGFAKGEAPKLSDALEANMRSTPASQSDMGAYDQSSSQSQTKTRQQTNSSMQSSRQKDDRSVKNSKKSSKGFHDDDNINEDELDTPAFLRRK